jgi:hypothetical protein
MDKPVKKDSGLDIASLRKGSSIQPSRSLDQRLATAGFKTSPDLQSVMMFDITGSMFAYFEQVKEKISGIADKIAKRAIRTEISIFAYRNHGDEKNHGKIFHASPFMRNIAELHAFVSQIKKGGGGKDGLTCMEDCFAQANRLGWRTDSAKSITIIGDMPPHGVLDSISACPNEINYRYEVTEFKRKNIKLYPVFCGHNTKVREFYRWLAEETGGKFLELDEIDLLSDLLVAIWMKSAGKLDEHIASLTTTGANRLPEKTEHLLKMLK